MGQKRISCPHHEWPWFLPEHAENLRGQQSCQSGEGGLQHPQPGSPGAPQPAAHQCGRHQPYQILRQYPGSIKHPDTGIRRCIDEMEKRQIELLHTCIFISILFPTTHCMGDGDEGISHAHPYRRRDLLSPPVKRSRCPSVHPP